VTVSVAAWLTPGNAERNRTVSQGPRAFDAKGLATMHHILVQLSEVALRPRFAEACKAFGDVVWCDDLDDLAIRAGAREALAVVVDSTDRQGRPTSGAVARIRARSPELPIVLWCDRRGLADRIAPFLSAGASAVIFRDESELERRLLTSITRASDVAFQQLTDQALHRRIPTPFIPVARFCLDHAVSMPRAEMIARSVGMSPKTLAGQLRRAGLPPVSALVMWAKALGAAYRLEKTTDSVTTIARALGFSSGSALRRLLKRCTNETPQALREPGGFGWALRCFERFLVKVQTHR
jgi:AraC-like DNA-binding protein